MYLKEIPCVNKVTIPYHTIRSPPGGWGWGGALSYKRLMGMCRWMGSHFDDWIDYSGVAISIEVLEGGRTFSDFWGKSVLHIYG